MLIKLEERQPLDLLVYVSLKAGRDGYFIFCCPFFRLSTCVALIAIIEW